MNSEKIKSLPLPILVSPHSSTLEGPRHTLGECGISGMYSLNLDQRAVMLRLFQMQKIFTLQDYAAIVR